MYLALGKGMSGNCNLLIGIGTSLRFLILLNSWGVSEIFSCQVENIGNVKNVESFDNSRKMYYIGEARWYDNTYSIKIRTNPLYFLL